MSIKPWTGEAELQSALQELCNQRPVPISKIRQAVSVANKYHQEFKMVVYEIEKFIKKATIDDKIAGIYVVDSLCRQHSKERDTFVKRFSLRLKDTMGYLAKVSSKDRVTLVRFIDEWQKKEVFPSNILLSIVSSLNFPELMAAQKRAENNDQSMSAKNSISSAYQGAPDLSVDDSSACLPAVKLCPFREGCPHGDKCRFNHSTSIVSLGSYALRLPLQSDAEFSTRASRKRLRHELSGYKQDSFLDYFVQSKKTTPIDFERQQIRFDGIFPSELDSCAYEVRSSSFYLCQPQRSLDNI